MTTPLSIITICFRNPTDLLGTLQSLAGVPPTVEIIVIDGSPDAECAKIAAQFPRVRHLQQPDHGKYDAMNKGVAQATGDGLLFLNSGDELTSPDRLARLLDEFGDRFAHSIVYGDCIHRAAGRDIPVLAPTPTGENLRLGRLPSHQSTIIPRQYHSEHLYDETMYFAADTHFLKEAYRALSAIPASEAIGIFSHGGASTSPGGIRMLGKQYRELKCVHELTIHERISLVCLLAKRKLLHWAVGEQRLQQIQARRLVMRHPSR